MPIPTNEGQPTAQRMELPRIIVRIKKNVRSTTRWHALLNEVDQGAKQQVPIVWPSTEEQLGPYCGLLALSIALKYAHISAPPAYVPPTDNSRRPLSLLALAKKMGVSSIGEIFSVIHFAHILQALNIACGTPIQTSRETFIQNICDQLDRSNSLIVSCDLGSGDFPDVNEGKRAHWVLIFGYIHLKPNDELHFLITQYGRYFLWSAADLLRSNIQDSQIHFSMGDTTQPSKAVALKIKSGVAASQFYCSIFSVPTVCPRKQAAERRRQREDVTEISVKN